MKDVREIVHKLRSMKNAKNLEGMARFGINTENAVGVSVTTLRKMGRELGRNHELALSLWSTGIHEARILASIVAEPERVTKGLMEKWVKDFDS